MSSIHARKESPLLSANAMAWLAAATIATVQAALLAYSATKHSPTLNEPGHLAAGLAHHKLGRFDIYSVNPPLVHMVAALPVLFVSHNEDWSGFNTAPGSRHEFQIGDDFVRVNGERSVWLFTIARWGCLVFPVIGGLCCFLWSRELWGANSAGLISMLLWTFDPNILAHAELVTTDCAASAFGLLATYLFWRWLRCQCWQRAILAGTSLGLALLTKSSWLILFVVLPVSWILWRALDIRKPTIPETSVDRGISSSKSAIQLSSILLLALYILNLGYGFRGSCTKLQDFTFVCKAFTGRAKAGETGNRFQNTWAGTLPIPLPRDFLQGIDLQKRDFEDYAQPSYMRGQWKDGGWWYYYAYGLAVKTPHGSQMMIFLAVLAAAKLWNGSPKACLSRMVCLWGNDLSLLQNVRRKLLQNLFVVVLPPVSLFTLVSSETEFNHHLRYVLPVFGFTSVFCGANWLWFVRIETELAEISKF